MKRCLENADRLICPDYPEMCTKCGAFREPTNADHIRSMSDEELEVFIEQIIPINCDCCVYMKLCRLEYDEETVNYAEKYSCRDGIMKWLKQPAERFGQECCPDQMEEKK